MCVCALLPDGLACLPVRSVFALGCPGRAGWVGTGAKSAWLGQSSRVGSNFQFSLLNACEMSLLLGGSTC